MKEEYVLFANTIFHVCLFIFCIYRFSIKNLSTIISIFFVVSSLFSLGLYFSPFYYLTYTSNGVATIQSALLLDAITSLWVLAFAKFNINDVKSVAYYNKSLINGLEKFLILVFALTVIISLPKTAALFFSGQDLGMLREDSYGSNLVTFTGIQAIIYYNVQDYLGGLVFFLLCIPLVKYLLFNEFSNWDKAALIVYLLMKLNTVFSVISRATIVFSMIEIVFCLFIFWKFIPPKYKRKIFIFTGIVIPISIIGLVEISKSRFDSGEKLYSEFVTFRYAGESQLNFMTLLYPDLKEPFWGYTAFPVFRGMLGLDYETGSNREGSDVFNSAVQKKFHYSNPTYIFYGLPGVMVFNFGRLGGLIVSILVFLLIRGSSKNNKQELSFMTICCFIYFASQTAKSVFFTDMFGISGNRLFIFIILFTLILRQIGYSRNIYLYNRP